MLYSYCMRYEHFPLLTHGIIRAQSECPPSRQASFYIQRVCQQLLARLFSLRIPIPTRGARYSNVNRVLFTIKHLFCDFKRAIILISRQSNLCGQSIRNHRITGKNNFVSDSNTLMKNGNSTYINKYPVEPTEYYLFIMCKYNHIISHPYQLSNVTK